ncbi:hypothetical protein G6F63_016190 [Rhizopus arrhizus]|nr:hypothetical protein G6F63_016190 [Rhizopus arrhizus]
MPRMGWPLRWRSSICRWQRWGDRAPGVVRTAAGRAAVFRQPGGRGAMAVADADGADRRHQHDGRMGVAGDQCVEAVTAAGLSIRSMLMRS